MRHVASKDASFEVYVDADFAGNWNQDHAQNDTEKRSEHLLGDSYMSDSVVKKPSEVPLRALYEQ